MKKIILILLGMIFLIGIVSASAVNVSILHGWNGTNFIPLELDSSGALKVLMNKTLDLFPMASNTYNLGSSVLRWLSGHFVNLFVYEDLRVLGEGNFSGTIYINNATDISTFGASDAYYRTYDTGWISRSDWTNVHLGSSTTKNADSNVTHNLNAPLSNLTVKVLISSDGTDANSFELYATNVMLASAGDLYYGYNIYQINSNNIKVQTGLDGIIQILDDGTRVTIDTEDWYYKVKVTEVIRLNTTPLFGGTPAGAIMAFNLETCPNGWVLADGTSGTPDLRGIFVRGAGTSGVLKYANGSYFTAGIGTYQNDSFQGHRHSNLKATAAGDPVYPTLGTTPASSTSWGRDPITDGSHGTPRTGAETTPAYYAAIYCMKTTEDTVTSNTIWATSGDDVILNDASKNLVLSGNLTADNYFAYGQIYTNYTFTISAVNVWYNLTLNSSENNLKNIIHSTTTNSHLIQVNSSGVYSISYYIVGRNAGTATGIAGRLRKNQATEIPGSFSQVTAGGASYSGEISQTTITSLNKGDNITLQAGSTNAGTIIAYYDDVNLPNPDVFVSASVTIIKLSQ